MALNSSKCRALNETAQGVAEMIEYWQNKVHAEYQGQMPPKRKEPWWQRTNEDPPPEDIVLPRRLVRTLVATMGGWHDDLLEHTEPFAK